MDPWFVYNNYCRTNVMHKGKPMHSYFGALVPQLGLHTGIVFNSPQSASHCLINFYISNSEARQCKYRDKKLKFSETSKYTNVLTMVWLIN